MPVPPGTEAIVAVYNWTREGPFSDQDRLGPEARLFWYAGPWLDEVGPDERETGRAVFRVPVNATMTDSVYTTTASESVWSFGASLEPRTLRQDPVFGGEIRSPMYFEGELDVAILATNRSGASVAELLSDVEVK